MTDAIETLEKRKRLLKEMIAAEIDESVSVEANVRMKEVDSALSLLQPAESIIRPFEDLIKEIEVDGEKFIPAQKIAALCFNYSGQTVQHKAQMWVNSSYDCAMWYLFETKILQPKKHLCSVGIYRSFDIRTYHEFDDSKQKSGAMPPCNQVEIVKLLIKWGFVKPQ